MEPVPGYEAPCYISWGRRNRSSLVRIPQYRQGKENATRVELRSPDPGCNPYLAFAAMLSAGLEGIKHQYPLPDPIEDDIYGMSVDVRNKRRIESLPPSLEAATDIFEKSTLMRETLGEHIFNTLIANKRVECDRFRKVVTDYEIENYLPIL